VAVDINPSYVEQVRIRFRGPYSRAGAFCRRHPD
jgi:hypothetical protein